MGKTKTTGEPEEITNEEDLRNALRGVLGRVSPTVSPPARMIALAEALKDSALETAADQDEYYELLHTACLIKGLFG